MEKSLSQIKNVDHEILKYLDDRSLLEFCKTSQYGKQLCNDENFWKQKTFSKYGIFRKNQKRTWKDFYLLIVYYMDKYNSDIDTILFNLSKRGMKNIDLINFFLARGANPNAGLDGASRKGYKDLVEYFMSRGANNILIGYMNAILSNHQDLAEFFKRESLQILGLN